MQYVFNHAATPALRFTPTYNICPHCAGGDFKTIESVPYKLVHLCFHCRQEYNEYLIFKFEFEEKMRDLIRRKRSRLNYHRKVA